MTSKRLLQTFGLLTLLLSPLGLNQQVRVRASSVGPSYAFQSQPTVSMSVSPPNLNVGETATVTVRLDNVPAEGFTSIELTCSYSPNLVEPGNILVTDLFGADPAVAIRNTQNDRFIVAIAGAGGNKATNSGTLMTFTVKGLQGGQSPMECQARASRGDNALTTIASAGNNVMVLIPTPTSTTGFCDSAEFVADVNVPPGTVMGPGAQFTKTWRLKNVGSCPWTTSYQLVFFNGEQMSAPASMNFPVNVSPGQTVDLSLNMTAPSGPGSYRGGWMFKNANGALFGAGPQANEPWFVDIVVSGATVTPSLTASQTPSPTLETNTLTPSPTGTISQTPGTPTASPSPTPSLTPGGPTATPLPGVVYDFVAGMCSAIWSSGAGQLPCPGIDGTPNGFVFKVDHPQLENGATNTPPGLLTFPQNAPNGSIQGFYPPFHVQNGDRFHSILSCEFGATGCYVAFRIDYQVGSEPIRTLFGPFLERYDGLFFTADVDLSALAGKDVKFILTLLSSGIAKGDRALWVGPVIYRTGSNPTPTASQTPSPTSTLEGSWTPFQSDRYGFRFLYPSQAQLESGGGDNFARINLPRAPGTNLGHKYLEMIVAENANPCRSPLATESGLETSGPVVINGLSFLKETGQDATAGHTNKWVAYSTSRDNVCVSLDFILRAADPGNFATPPPRYDEAAESLVFSQIVSTFTWLTGPTITPVPGTGILNGKVLASKPVTIKVYNAEDVEVGSGSVNPDGNFQLSAPSTTTTIIASAPGFLRAQRSMTIPDGSTTTLPALTLIPGDIDNNNVIDQFDALTIGMNYNKAVPAEADLNNDGIINVLDLELLAKNYRKTGPVAWE